MIFEYNTGGNLIESKERKRTDEEIREGVNKVGRKERIVTGILIDDEKKKSTFVSISKFRYNIFSCTSFHHSFYL